MKLRSDIVFGNHTSFLSMVTRGIAAFLKDAWARAVA